MNNKKVFVIVNEKKVEIHEDQVVDFQKEAERLVRIVHRDTNSKSIIEWYKGYESTRNARAIISAQLCAVGLNSLDTHLGWAWFTQIYIPAQKKTKETKNISPCPRLRTWQIEERMNRDYDLAMQSEKRAGEENENNI